MYQIDINWFLIKQKFVVCSGFAHLTMLSSDVEIKKAIKTYHGVSWQGKVMRVEGKFEEAGVVLWRLWCGTLKMVVCYFEECGVVLWRWRCGTLKRVLRQKHITVLHGRAKFYVLKVFIIMVCEMTCFIINAKNLMIKLA